MLSLTPTPLANSFPDHPDTDAERFPLDVTQCILCDHVQLGSAPAVDWVDYRYATPEAVRPHLAAAASVLRGTYPEAKTVLEIGCNNGLYLEELRRVGFSAVGIDPSTTVGIARPFSHYYAKMFLEPVDLIVANNVLAHVDDLWDVFRGIDHLLKDDGALVFEVQYFPYMVRDGSFDMIYHEHRDYHTLAPWPAFLKRFGLFITKVEPIPTHGGSVRIFCERPGVGVWCIPNEATDWRAFKHRIADAKAVVFAQVAAADGPIVAFGATAKACTLIHHFGLADLIDYCVDSTPGKRQRYIPGTSIQIVSPDVIGPEITILLTAWNFETEIRAQFTHNKFIVPFSKEVVCPV
jgi:SAM-dependent methyltransferase